MVEYVQKFSINRVTYGIEEKEGRFQLWKGGCGIGNASSLDGARKMIRDYAASALRMEIESYQDIISRTRRALDILEMDPLGHFEVKEESKC